MPSFHVDFWQVTARSRDDEGKKCSIVWCCSEVVDLNQTNRTPAVQRKTSLGSDFYFEIAPETIKKTTAPQTKMRKTFFWSFFRLINRNQPNSKNWTCSSTVPWLHSQMSQRKRHFFFFQFFLLSILSFCATSSARRVQNFIEWVIKSHVE